MDVTFEVCIIFNNLDVCACTFKENVPIETFHILFESTQNKLQYGTKITCTEVRGGGGGGGGKGEYDARTHNVYTCAFIICSRP